MMFKIEDQLPDSHDDELSRLLKALNAKQTWDGEARSLFNSVEVLLAELKYTRFTGDYRDYHLTRKGQYCLYDVPSKQSGALKAFRNKRVRLVCLGGWDSYAGRAFYVGEVQVKQ